MNQCILDSGHGSRSTVVRFRIGTSESRTKERLSFQEFQELHRAEPMDQGLAVSTATLVPLNRGFKVRN
jgi:hypothetical protein